MLWKNLNELFGQTNMLKKVLLFIKMGAILRHLNSKNIKHIKQTIDWVLLSITCIRLNFVYRYIPCKYYHVEN